MLSKNVSTEKMSLPVTKESIKSRLYPLNFTQIQVVFGYGCFFEWIPSEYNEEMKQNIYALTIIAFGDWYAQQLYSTHPHSAFTILDGMVLH
jgi:hypothetical protein